MAYLLGKLVERLNAGEWRVLVRGGSALALGKLPKFAKRRLVLLSSDGPRWTIVRRVRAEPWPSDFPRDLDELWRVRQEAIAVDVSAEVMESGRYTCDPRGAPCERGVGRRRGVSFEILNYAGWELSALKGATIEVFSARMKWRTYWIVPPDSVPYAPTPAAAPAPPIHRSPRPVSVDARLRFSELTFTDGGVQLPLGGRAITVRTDLAREIYNDVRTALDAELGEGVRAVGELHADGAWVGELRGLEALASAFTTVTRRRFVERGLALPTWADAQALMAELSGAGDPLDRLLDLPEFCFERRKEAFRRLFEIRVREEPVRVLPGRAIVVPLPAAGGVRPWLAWEKTSGDYATYLFRPSTDEQRDDLLAWAQDPESRRRDLLRDEPLAEALAFHGRVMHRSAGGDDLAGWWRRLRATLAADPRL